MQMMMIGVIPPTISEEAQWLGLAVVVLIGLLGGWNAVIAAMKGWRDLQKGPDYVSRLELERLETQMKTVISNNRSETNSRLDRIEHKVDDVGKMLLLEMGKLQGRGK